MLRLHLLVLRILLVIVILIIPIIACSPGGRAPSGLRSKSTPLASGSSLISGVPQGPREIQGARSGLHRGVRGFPYYFLQGMLYARLPLKVLATHLEAEIEQKGL